MKKKDKNVQTNKILYNRTRYKQLIIIALFYWGEKNIRENFKGKKNLIIILHLL